jgi:hypothetical protein
MIKVAYFRSIPLAFALIARTPVAMADVYECQEAVRRYNSAVTDVSSALSWYTSCLSSSRGRDDCSSEFWSLQSAQSDFESAVSRYRRECQ